MDIPEKMSIKKLTNGSITNQIMENPVMYPNKMRPNRTWCPWDLIFNASCGFVFMSQPENIWDPSKGATGIMLKTANAILIRVK